MVVVLPNWIECVSILGVLARDWKWNESRLTVPISRSFCLWSFAPMMILLFLLFLLFKQFADKPSTCVEKLMLYKYTKL